MKLLFNILALMLCLPLGLPTYAQVDLSAQRAEDQTVHAVGGAVKKHSVVINPTPQSLSFDGGTVDASAGFALQGKCSDFKTDFIVSNPNGLKLSIAYGKKKGVEKLSGAYSLKISNKGIAIHGHDKRGAFYGLQTLRQILETAPIDALPLLSINDFPSLEHRGVVEGFYGTPWSHQVRLSLIDFMDAIR